MPQPSSSFIRGTFVLSVAAFIIGSIALSLLVYLVALFFSDPPARNRKAQFSRGG